METSIQSVCWEAQEHHHTKKSDDWYWIVGIFAGAGSIASIIFGNVLFGIVIILAALTMTLASKKNPRIIDFEVSSRGIRVERDLYPYPSIESYYVDEHGRFGPQLFVKPHALFSQLLIIPIPEAYIDDIDAILSSRVPEEHLQEPLSHIVLEYLGF